MKKNINKIKNKFNVTVIILFVFLCIYALSLLAMYFWGLFTSLKSNAEFRTNLYWLPKGVPWKWYFDNYTWAFTSLTLRVINNNEIRYVNMFGLLTNSLIFSLGGPFIGLLITWLIAYLIASFPNKILSRIIIRLNIIVMLIPIIGSLPSALQLYKAMGIYDTWFYVVFVGLGSFTGVNLIIFQSYMATIAKEIREAASIDGASNFSIMLKISFPLTIKMFATLYILAFIGAWNNYMTCLIWLPSKPTIAYGIFKLTADTTTVGSWAPPQMAGCILLALPMLIVFIIFRNKIIGQVTMGALKG